MKPTIRIVQIGERAFIVQERGRFWGWNTWQEHGAFDYCADEVHETFEEARQAIRAELAARKADAAAKNFARKVVWP